MEDKPEYTGKAQWFVVVMRPGDQKPRHFSEATYYGEDPFTIRTSYYGRREIGKDVRTRPPSHVLPEMERMYEEAKANADALLNALVVTTEEQVQEQVVAKLTGEPWNIEDKASDKHKLLMRGWTEMLDTAKESQDPLGKLSIDFAISINSVRLSWEAGRTLHYSGKLPSLFHNRHLVHQAVEQWCRMLRA